MNTDGAMRLVISPSEAISWLNFLESQGQAFPEWSQDWDGVSSVWLEAGGQS